MTGSGLLEFIRLGSASSGRTEERVSFAFEDVSLASVLTFFKGGASLGRRPDGLRFSGIMSSDK